MFSLTFVYLTLHQGAKLRIHMLSIIIHRTFYPHHTRQLRNQAANYQVSLVLYSWGGVPFSTLAPRRYEPSLGQRDENYDSQTAFRWGLVLLLDTRWRHLLWRPLVAGLRTSGFSLGGCFLPAGGSQFTAVEWDSLHLIPGDHDEFLDLVLPIFAGPVHL